jgi:hypothetical protein
MASSHRRKTARALSLASPAPVDGFEGSRADVWVFDGSEGISLEVVPDSGAWTTLREAWDRFWEYLVTKTPPPLAGRDVRVRDDPEWLDAAAAYLELKTACDELSAKLGEAKSQLVGLASHAREQGGGLSVTRYWKAGAIDYKKIPELKALELEPYRSAARQEVRVTIG